MITLIKSGTYKLIETKANIKILYLDNQPYAWVIADPIGQILVISHVPHVPNRDLAMGRYHLYKVKDEPYLTDLEHLELEYGKHAWQSYLLPTGLPNSQHKRTRLIPANETITNNPLFTKSVRFGLKRRVSQKKELRKAY